MGFKEFRLNKDCTLYLKGIAIILVIISHMIQRELFDIPFLEWGGQMGVTIFLLLSGYGLAKSYQEKGLNNFFYKRICSVFVPYFIVTFIWVIIDNAILKQGYSIKIIAAALLGFDYSRTVDPSMWYITYILLWYAAFFIVFSMKVRKEIKILLLLSISAVLFFCFPSLSLLSAFKYQFKIYAFMFPLGIVAGLYLDKILNKLKHHQFLLLLSCMATGFVCFILLLSPNGSSVSPEVLFARNICWGIGIISTFILLANQNFKLKPLKIIGEYSFELYLFEFILLSKYSIIKLLNNTVLGVIAYLLILGALSFVLKKTVTFLLGWNEKGLKSEQLLRADNIR